MSNRGPLIKGSAQTHPHNPRFVTNMSTDNDHVFLCPVGSLFVTTLVMVQPWCTPACQEEGVGGGVGGGKTWTCCRGQCSHRTTHTRIQHTKTWTRLMAQWHTMRRATCEGKILFKKKNTQKLKITYFDSFGERSLFWVKNTFCFDENTLTHKRTQLANYAPIIHTFLVQYSPPN